MIAEIEGKKEETNKCSISKYLDLNIPLIESFDEIIKENLTPLSLHTFDNLKYEMKRVIIKNPISNSDLKLSPNKLGIEIIEDSRVSIRFIVFLPKQNYQLLQQQIQQLQQENKQLKQSDLSQKQQIKLLQQENQQLKQLMQSKSSSTSINSNQFQKQSLISGNISTNNNNNQQTNKNKLFDDSTILNDEKHKIC